MIYPESMQLDALFKNHVSARRKAAEALLNKHQFDAMVINAGAPFTYFADDQDAPFRPTPHFAHWVPTEGPHHLLVVKPGQKPKLNYYFPNDFWHEHQELKKTFWTEEFEIEVFHELPKLYDSLKPIKNACFIGPEIKGVDLKSFALNPMKMINPLNWDRSYKTDYEVHCLKEANRIGAKAHHRAYEIFASGGSERDIYYGFVEACHATENELAYKPIIALNEKGAILHYTNVRDFKPGSSMLIDASARFQHYNSDITRTYVKESGSSEGHKLFAELIKETQKLQLKLCSLIKAGMKYSDLHYKSELFVAETLLQFKFIQGVTAESAVEQGLARAFYPHGVGHMLGIQVHDVGGKQADADDSVPPPQTTNRYLRNLRTIDVGNVFTIEPGIYFIPLLLDPMRKDNNKLVNWSLVDKVIHLGGIRIEDDVLCTPTGHENLTRLFLP